MHEAREIRWRTQDRRFGIVLAEERLQEILQLCRRAGGHETGGILIGRYTERLDLAVVHQVTGPPPNSASGRTWFHRGELGLQKLLLRRWREQREYYLGEWHFHPGAAPIPSRIDEEQMQSISRSSQYRCPEPILLIVGGDPLGEWTLSARVYPRDAEPQEMTDWRSS